MNTLNIITSPLDQFEIRDLISVDAPLVANLHISLTNIALYLVIAFFITLNVNLLSNNYNKIVSNN
jgi:F-type H+-transporting ATPase subunit a